MLDLEEAPNKDPYVYDVQYQGVGNRYRNTLNYPIQARRGEHTARTLFRGARNFEDWLQRVWRLAAEVRHEPITRSWGPSVCWAWNADLSFVIQNTTVKWPRWYRSTTWGLDKQPRYNLRCWELPSREPSQGLMYRAYTHFVAERWALFYRDFVAAHYFWRGNAGTATVLVNALGDRTVRADERLDLIAMVGSTADFLKMWRQCGPCGVVGEIPKAHISLMDRIRSTKLWHKSDDAYGDNGGMR